MAKDPAFLFYPGDFTTGTQFFTDEQVGKYIRLLMAQHQLGHLPENHMIIICKSYDNDIFSKFIKDKDGKYFNQRLEDEIIKLKKYTESRGKNRRGEKIISNSYGNHMENKNENINKDISNNIIIGWFEDLKNGSAIETISIQSKIDKTKVLEKLDEFKRVADLDYTDYKAFVRHFKNWLLKNPPAPESKYKGMVF